MYSYEIDNLLKIRNFIISNAEYFDICKNSPQISNLRYIPEENNFYLKTKDNYDFKFKVYCKEKK